jgi:1,4-dihydroxy-2-naphthoate octaprenyltransferase
MSTASPATRPSPLAIWLAAIRPATLWAGVTPVAVGTALAFVDGVAQWLPAVAALVGALLIQIGTNLFNDYADFVKGADTEERLGPARVTQKGWLTARQVATAAALTFGASVLVGSYLVLIGGWPIVWIGIASIACGVLYTGGPYPLGYIGLGDVFVLAFFGVVAVCGTYYVQALTVSTAAVLASLAVGALATAILVVNNLRDRFTDVKAGKRTLAVRFGGSFARVEYIVLVAAAYLVPVAVVVSGLGGPGWLVPLMSLPLAIKETRGVLTKEGVDLNPHLGGTARLGMVHGLLLSLGVLL